MTRRPSFPIVMGAALMASVNFFTPARAADQNAIDASIAKAQRWLLSTENKDNWEHANEIYQTQKTGWTALTVNALLSSGVNSQSAGVAAAIKYLEKNDTNGVYALGCRMLVWQRLPASPDVRQCAIHDSAKLLNGIGTRGEARGMYGYEVGDGGYSHSRSQYGVLGMSAAQMMGIDVPGSYWKQVEASWKEQQFADGSWNYKGAQSGTYPSTTGMTTAGVASILLAQEALRDGESIDCHGMSPDQSLARGLKWLADHNSEIANSEAIPRNYPYSALYGVERVGAAGGIKYFGKVNWYQKGADWLIANQRSNGSWARSGEDDTNKAAADTCFGLLFLAHGRAPVFMEKLDYSSDPSKTAEWNQRPRDVANLARRTGQELEQELSWEIVTLQSPVDDYHDAPILYVSGKDPITLTSDAKAKLRDFVQGGGMIVANADCGGNGFANSFKKLAVEISPYEFRPLPREHPIFTRQQFPSSRWKTQTTIYGLSNGVRELMILIPNADPGKYWEMGVGAGHEQMWELGADLFEYVASRTNLRSRGESYVVQKDSSIKATTTLSIGRLKYGGNWDPEPGGWRRLANLMHNDRRIDLDVREVSVNSIAPDVPIMHMTGTQLFHPGDEAQKQLKEFVANGGTLIVDAAGGSPDFATSMEAELIKIFGQPLTLIDGGDPIWLSGGTKLSPVHYRNFAIDRRGTLNQARIKGIKIKDRYGVFFSSDDLSAGLVGQQVDGIIGYAPDTATDIMQHLLLYAQATSKTNK